MPRSARPLIISEELSAIREDWAALHARVPGASPFTHPAWHETWLRHLGHDARPLYLEVRLEEELIGVAALDAATAAPCTLGDPNVRDYGGPLVAPGHEGAVASCLLEWLLEDLTPFATLWGVAKGSATHEAFVQAADYWGWRLTEADETVSPATELPASWDEYVAGLSRHDRHELRRKLRRLDAAGTVEFSTVSSPEEVANGMDALFAMMRASHADKGEFLTAAMEGFFRDLAVTFAGLGMTRLGTLTLDGACVATLLMFDCGGTRYLYNSGYDPERQDLAVGLLSKALSVRDAIACGLARYDFLRGAEPYKAHLGGQPNELVTLEFRR